MNFDIRAGRALWAHRRADALRRRIEALDPRFHPVGEIERLRSAVEDLRARAVQAALRGAIRQ